MFKSHDVRLAAYGAFVAVLAAISSFLGVFARGDGSYTLVTSVRGVTYEMAITGVYANNAKQVVAEGIGWDAFTLFVAVPATLVALWFVGRGSFRARLVAIGMFGYFFYQYLEYAMTWALGPMFPLFVAIFGLSLIGIVVFASSVARADIEGRFATTFPHRGFIAITVAMSAMLTLMWSGRIATGLAGDLVGAGLHGETTLVVQALDLGLVVPIALLGAYLVYRRTDVARTFAAAYVVSAVAMASAIIAMLVSAAAITGDVASALPPIVIFGVFVIGYAYVAIRIYAGIVERSGNESRQAEVTTGTRWMHRPAA